MVNMYESKAVALSHRWDKPAGAYWKTMIEIVIERWTNAEGETGFGWSVWSEGHRIQMGEKDCALLRALGGRWRS